MSHPLDPLVDDGIIDEVLGRLKSGKEADIYRVRRAGQIIAAKVYKDRATRSFKSNADYKEGREIRSSRTRRAIEAGSRFGRESEEDAWKSAEADALGKLFAAGLRVPQPIMFYEGVLLMQLVADTDGNAAPRLIELTLTPATANALYIDLRAQIVGMLCLDLIHGDLSPYNILDGAAGATIIDFPQIVSAPHNSRAEYFFRRDFENVREFLAASDPSLLAYRDDARKIWTAYGSRDLTPSFVPSPPTPPSVRNDRGDRNDRSRGWREGGQRDAGPAQPRISDGPSSNERYGNGPGQNRPGQNQRFDNRPGQNGPAQNQRFDNRPGQNRPPQNGPAQNQRFDNRPPQNGPAQNQRFENRSGQNGAGQNQRFDNRPPQNGPGPNQRFDNRPAQNGPGPARRFESRPGQNGPGPNRPQQNRPGQYGPRSGDSRAAPSQSFEPSRALTRNLRQNGQPRRVQDPARPSVPFDPMQPVDEIAVTSWDRDGATTTPSRDAQTWSEPAPVAERSWRPAPPVPVRAVKPRGGGVERRRPRRRG